MNSIQSLLRLSASVLTVFALANGVDAMSVLNTPHNLAASGPGRIKSTEERVCIFCHTPHHSTKLSDLQYPGPLWVRQENTADDYTPYESTTIKSKPFKPLGASRLCLSCHDGTIALGAPANLATTANLPSLATYPAPPYPKKSAVLGKDLRDDHPISMQYGIKIQEFYDVTEARSKKARFSIRDGVPFVECTSCHDPHDNQYGNFLVVDTSNQHDALCTACHNKNNWSGSAHQTGGTRCSGTVPTDVQKDGCVSCHTPHAAEQGADLLHLSSAGAGMDTNCYVSCHNGVSQFSNLPAEFNPAGRYVHPLTLDIAVGRHTPDEKLPIANIPDKHVHCVDCHNPHQAAWQNAPLDAIRAPVVNGVLAGVRGVTLGKVEIDPAQNEYQICLRCHAGARAEDGTFNDPSLKIERIFNSYDESIRFNPAPPVRTSFHPVAGITGGSGISLKTGAKTTYIYCSSCHHPHGSDWPHILRLENQDNILQTVSTSYPLCYSCHDDQYLISNGTSGALHKAHVFGLHRSGTTYMVPCSVCHDPHGVPYIAGRTTTDNSGHLINFDSRYVPFTAAYSVSGQSCSIVGAGPSGIVCHPASVVNPAIYNPYPFNP